MIKYIMCMSLHTMITIIIMQLKILTKLTVILIIKHNYAI